VRIGGLKRYFSRRKLFTLLFVALAIAFWNSLPQALMNPDRSLALLDCKGRIISARLAKDAQWRFPATDSLPQNYVSALLTFEDKRFYYHPGVDPLALARALRLNLKHRRIISGGSTISMQVIRLAKKNPPRSIPQKLIEMIQALRLELSYSKDEILKIYANNCPLGANIVGVEAAAVKYFGRRAGELSWAEAALLAVLPNDPSLLFPGRNSDELKRKRDGLLLKLREKGAIDNESYMLALAEKIPQQIRSIPDWAPHFANKLLSDGVDPTKFVQTTINLELQQRCLEATQIHHKRLKNNHIENLAVLVADNERKSVLAYIGNSGLIYENDNAGYVDNVIAPRSPGSALKPFLFVSLFNEGLLLPDALVADIPVNFGGYQPENFDRSYRGAVPASEALARSLNVPAVRLLSRYGVQKFYHRLTQLHFNHINKGSDYYGLTLILGGVECTLWELVRAYSGLASIANGPVFKEYAFTELKTIEEHDNQEFHSSMEYSPGAVYALLEALKELKRPDHDGQWMHYESALPIAWKTGTSMGFRDAWAIGVTPQYTVGVWVGNSSGEGRPDLTGLKAAAPLMFDIFNRIQKEPRWFAMPEIDMTEIEICQESGFRAGKNCSHVVSKMAPFAGLNSPLCTYHKIVFLDSSQQYQVNSECYSPSKMVRCSFFTLPPAMDWFYRRTHPQEALPPFHPDCNISQTPVIDFLYPETDAKILIPRSLGGRLEAVVFEALHSEKDAVLFWYLDDFYLGMTESPHKMAVSPKTGNYILSVTDQNGKQIRRKVQITTGEKE